MKSGFQFILFSCFIFIPTSYSTAQIINQKVADSLKIVLRESEYDDETKYDLIVKIAAYETNLYTQVHFIDQALSLAVKNNNLKWEAKSRALLGQSYAALGDLDKSLEFLIQSAHLYNTIDYRAGEAAVNLEIGSVFMNQMNYDLSLSYYRKANKTYLKINDSIGYGSSLLNIGEDFRLTGELDSGLFYFDKSKIIFENIDYQVGIAYSLGNIGLVHAELDQYDSAEYYLHQATEILEELGDRYPIAVYQTYMADIYRDKQEWDRALEYARSSLMIAEEEGLKEQIRDASLKLSELYHDTGEFEKAYDYQSQYIAFRDSINNEDVIRKMADLRTEYEVSKKQAEVDLLEQKRENEKWIMFSLLSVLGFISVLAFFTFRNNLARKRTNMLLSAQKTKIESQNDKLESLIKMKDKFFGIISHDLRGPVNSLNGITQLLKHYVKTKNSEELEQLTTLMDKSVESLSTLLDNLLSWALSQQGALPYEPKIISVESLIKSVQDVFKNSARAKAIELKIDVEEGLELYADEDSVHALLRNVLNNAIKFTKEKGKVELVAKKEANNVLITITDNGQGMNEYQLRNLFKVNKKKVNKGTMGEKGSGLGMLLCKEIVKLNKGKIEAESEQGSGTKIEILLPLKPA